MAYYPKTQYKMGKYKYTCEYSGIPFYSDTQTKDWQGHIVNKRFADKRPLAEDPIIIPKGEMRSIKDTRPRQTGTARNTYTPIAWPYSLD